MILFNVHGGNKIGIGHLMRSSALAIAFKDIGETVLFFTNKYFDMLSDLGLDQKVVNDNAITRYLNKNDCIIVDRYDINQSYIDRLRKCARVGYIDDLGSVDYNSDFVINGNIYAKKGDYTQAKTCFLGTKYTLLRSEFMSKECIEVKYQVENVLITFGGSDPNQLTNKLLSYLYKMKRINFHIIVGPHFSGFHEIDGENLIYYHSPKAIKKIMLKCDLAITASGSTVYELASLGLPSINIIVADNQTLISETMDDFEISQSIGWFNSPNEIISHLKLLMNDFNKRLLMHTNGKKIFDGNSTKRLAKEIINFLEEENE